MVFSLIRRKLQDHQERDQRAWDDANSLLCEHTPRGAWLKARRSASEASEEKERLHWYDVQDAIVHVHGPQDRADAATRYLDAE